jgi:hypothetical protein
MLWYLIVAVDFFIFAALITKLRDSATPAFSPVISKTGIWALLIVSLLFFIPLTGLYFKLYPVSKPLHLVMTLLLWLFTAQGGLLAGAGKCFFQREHGHSGVSKLLHIVILPLLVMVAYWSVQQELQQGSLLNGWSILLMASIIGASVLLWTITVQWLYKLVSKTG